MHQCLLITASKLLCNGLITPCNALLIENLAHPDPIAVDLWIYEAVLNLLVLIMVKTMPQEETVAILSLLKRRPRSHFAFPCAAVNLKRRMFVCSIG